MADTIPFLIITVAYLVSGLAHGIYLYHPEWNATATWSARLALLVHTLALASMGFWSPTPAAGVVAGGLPAHWFTSAFSTTLFLTWVLMAVYVVIDAIRPVKVAGAFLLPAILALLLASLTFPRGAGPVPGFSSTRAFWHIVTAVISYSLFAISFVTSILYLVQEKQLREKEFRLFFYRVPPLEILDLWAHRLILIAYPLLTLSYFSGYFWAREAWGPHFQWDTKLIWTLLTWIIYGVYLVLRFAFGWRGRRAARLSIVGFSLVMVNYFVINIFFSRLHGF